MRWLSSTSILVVSLAACGVFVAACGAASSAQSRSAEEQIANAVLAAPEPLRMGAEVLGYGADGTLVTLQEGFPSNPLICLADDPARERFHVACYHRALEPYMSRGRELRAAGRDGSEAIAIRQDEAREGALLMPSHPAALYNLSAPARPSEPGREPEEAGRLFVIYVPGATTEELGLPPAPADGSPWLMYPGEPNAHIMISS